MKIKVTFFRLTFERSGSQWPIAIMGKELSWNLELNALCGWQIRLVLFQHGSAVFHELDEINARLVTKWKFSFADTPPGKSHVCTANGPLLRRKWGNISIMSELWFLTRSVCIVAAMYRPFRKHYVTLIKKQGDECARGFLIYRLLLMKMSSPSYDN